MDEGRLDIAEDGNLFPREAVLAAVAGADWRERPVPPAALACLAAGPALVVLATPVARPWLAGPVAWTDGGGAAWWHLPHLAAEAAVSLGAPVERAWFLVSALGHALALPALYLLLRAFGAGPGLSLAGALLAATGPLPFVLAELPSDVSFGVVAASLALAAAFGSLRRARPLPMWCRLAAPWAALWIHPSSAVLAAPLAFTVAQEPPAGMSPANAMGARRAAAATAGAVIALAAWSAIARARAAGAPLLGLGPELHEVALLAAPLCALAWLLARLVARAEEEARPPRWLVAAWALTLAFVVAHYAVVPGHGDVALVAPLVPLAAVAIADALHRAVDSRRAGRLALATGAALVLATALAEIALRDWDRRAVHAELAASAGAPADLSPEAQYVQRFRFAPPSGTDR